MEGPDDLETPQTLGIMGGHTMRVNFLGSTPPSLGGGGPGGALHSGACGSPVALQWAVSAALQVPRATIPLGA